MPHPRISLHHDEIDLLCERMTTHVAQIDEKLDNLEKVSGKLREQWDGDAREAYDDAHRQWDASMRELSEIARRLTGLAQRGNSTFRAHDQREASVWAL